MNTAQNYAPLHSVATPTQQQAQALPIGDLIQSLSVNDPNDPLLQLISMLVNVHYLSRNTYFMQQHGYLLTNSMHRLIAEVGKAIGDLDPFILEALSAHPVHTIQ